MPDRIDRREKTWIALLVTILLGACSTNKEPSPALTQALHEQAETFFPPGTQFTLKEIDLEIPLNNLRFFELIPRTRDSLGRRCAKIGSTIECEHSVIFEQIVGFYQLGANPQNLSPEAWVRLLSFVYHLEVVQDLQKDNLPEDRLTLQEPTVTFEANHTRIALDYRIVSSHAGYQGYGRANVLIARDDNIESTFTRLSPLKR